MSFWHWSIRWMPFLKLGDACLNLPHNSVLGLIHCRLHLFVVCCSRLAWIVGSMSDIKHWREMYVLSFGLKILRWKKHWQTKLRQWCQFRMITSGKSHSFILGSMWQLSISWNCENNNLLPFLELRQITMNCYIIFCLLSLVIVVFHLSAFMRFFSLFLLRVFRTSLLLCWKVIFSLKRW